MKRLFFIMMFIPAGLLFTNRSQAQVNVSVNIGNQPAWAPEGYDDAQYYYMPDMDIYYDVPAHQFVYPSNRRWVRSAALPVSYQKFDLYQVHKVAINQKNAYKNYRQDRKQYAQFKGKFDQHPIRDSRDDRYSGNRNNWENNRFKGNGRRENDHNNRPQRDGRH